VFISGEGRSSGCLNTCQTPLNFPILGVTRQPFSEAVEGNHQIALSGSWRNIPTSTVHLDYVGGTVKKG
jgi:hypothetical protein